MSLRVAFLTSEFVTDRVSGGLANYVYRMTQTLKRLGHEPEVFVGRLDDDIPDIAEHDGVRVEYAAVSRSLALRGLIFLERRLLRSPLRGSTGYLATAFNLARALERRHAEKPFDFIQSADCRATGLFVRRMRNRPHLVRLSAHRGLWWSLDGENSTGAQFMAALERACVRRADIAYSPSRFVAECCRRTGWRHDVQVVRPPVFLETEPASQLPPGVPARYLFHFGQIGVRKGSRLIASACRIVCGKAPDFRMVWAGRETVRGEFEQCRSLMGDCAANVTWLGATSKNVVYAVLRHAAASVLPSLADNLPNTVLESLLAGVPVIGSAGASIDELVEPGRNGELVPVGDVEALAAAMLRVWRRDANSAKPGFQPPAILSEMAPERAATQLLRLAGVA